MGNEIVYCGRCQSRLLAAEFEQGKAIRLSDGPVCVACLQTSERECLGRSRKSPSAPASPASSSSHRAAVVKPEPSRPGLVVAGVGGAVAVVAIVLIAVLGGSGKPPLPAPAQAPTPPVAKAPEEVGFGKDLDTLRADLAEPLAKGDIGLAQRVLDRARGRHTAPGWDRAIGGLDRDVAARAGRRYAELKSNAKIPDGLRAAKAEVAGWGPSFTSLLKELEGMALEAPPPKAEPVTPAPAAPSPYLAPWEKAMAFATRGDFARAIADLQAAGKEFKEDNAREIQDLERLRALAPEFLQVLASLTGGEVVDLDVVQEDGSRARVRGPLLKAGPQRLELQSEPRFVENEDIAPASLATLYARKKPREEPRLLALACAIDGDAEAGRKLLGDSVDVLPEKVWAYAEKAKGKRPGASREEWAARKLFYEAETAFASIKTRDAAMERYGRLLEVHADTGFVRRSRAEITARTEAAGETLLPSVFMAGNGIFKPMKVKAAFKGKPMELSAWASAKESNTPELQNNVEFEFYVSPGKEYKGWVLLGGCCSTTFTWFLQASDLTHVDLRSRKEFACDPSGTTAAPWNHGIRSSLTTHGGRDHAKQEKKPERWEWAELPMPKYGSGGLKKIRLIGQSKGMAVGAVIISPTRRTPLDEEELQKLEESDKSTFTQGKPKPEDWLVLGLFPGASIGEALPPDGEIKLEFETSVRNGPTKWKLVKVNPSEDNGSWKAKVDFHEHGIVGKGVAYAMLHLGAPRAMKLKLHYDHDDDMRLFINDKLVKEEGSFGTGTTMVDVVPGWNRVLFKIWDNGKPPPKGSFHVAARFTDESDRPAPGLTFDAYGPIPH